MPHSTGVDNYHNIHVINPLINQSIFLCSLCESYNAVSSREYLESEARGSQSPGGQKAVQVVYGCRHDVLPEVMNRTQRPTHSGRRITAVYLEARINGLL